ncbi:phosphonate transport system ATP-binding protein [Loktanella fryxellensis]|uniref:Phosphonate transport system ATP-binding protein n=1 Tax=Loktanella fryxellensis TaxID=245187 RepID=A0A1H8AA16_9RHOB|nr:ATP-binding cassette domain-containing protein [Loktanella fryxellensis]SEM66639.1 phosphonate transport system ATP-binding protein [Loktanella fryxellensis]
MTAPLVGLQDQTLGWGGQAVLRGIDLSLSAGERVVLLGRSGVGKSTLLAALQGGIAARVALVPQDHGLVGSLSVFHNVWMGVLDDHGTASNLRTLVWPAKAQRARVEAVLEVVGLGTLGRRTVGRLSGGQRQRVALARALLRRGDVVLGDEPVTALDPSQGALLLTHLVTQFPTAVLALHDIDQALRTATRIVGLRGGGIVLDAPAADLTAVDLLALYR